MYEMFYGLREKPFALTPDPAYLYPAKRYRHALMMLEYVPQAEETLGYVRHRIGIAGGHSDLFTQEALEVVHLCTGGVPRLKALATVAHGLPATV
jgi:hypothetical protein